MKQHHIFTFILAAIAAMALVTSCGEDRTYELEEKTQHNRWILEQMRDHYLWADALDGFEPEWKNLFGKPADFLKTLTGKAGKADQWSFVTIDTIAHDQHPCGHFNHLNSYGFDFILMNDPTGQSTKTYARVLTVYPNSPAAECGLRRDDFISTFDGYKISQRNTDKLERGEAITLAVSRLAVDGEEFTLTPERQLSLAASRYVEDTAFPVNSIVGAVGMNIGYLMCTRLVTGNGNGHEYSDALDDIMSQMQAANVCEFVLDLRLCNYGTIDMARRLASHLVNPIYINNVFAKTIYNQRHSAQNTSLTYDPSVSNLGLSRLFVIVSDRTQGAAEWLIHSLQCTMGSENIVVVGKATAGQTVMTQHVGSAFNLNLNPVVAYVADANGNYDYSRIVPDETTDETSFAFLNQYGDIDEPLFNAALQKMMQ